MQLLLCTLLVSAAPPTASVVLVQGDVVAQPPKGKVFGKLAVGDQLRAGTRVRVGEGRAELKFADGTKVRVHKNSEVRVAPRSPDKTSSVSLFFGRVWSKVVKKVRGGRSFEVQTANAVAGVRGTELEVGVADDGAARVLVHTGKVEVAGESGSAVPIGRGFEIQSRATGQLLKRRRQPRRVAWGTWFSRRARKLQKDGLRVARDLKGRLGKRYAKVEDLVRKQRDLRRQIARLEHAKRNGADVNEQLLAKTEEMEKITVRLESMKARLSASFGLFQRWGAMAEQGQMGNAEEVGKLASDIDRIAREFADLVEEGTDLSEDSMNEMMEEMKNGKDGITPF